MKKLLAVLIVFSLYGCGGSNNAQDSPPQPPPQSEGTFDDPINLGLFSSPFTRNGSISANGTSFYKFTTDASGRYFIYLSANKASLYWTIFLPNQNALFSCTLVSPQSTTACFIPNLSANTTYYLDVFEVGNIADTFTIKIHYSIF